MDRLIYHDTAGSVVISEAALGDNISGTKCSGTSAGVGAQGHPRSIQYDEIQCLITKSILESRKSEVPSLSHRRRIGRHPHGDI